MTTILFLKSHVSGYTRADGTVVRAHEDRRRAAPSKKFGSVAGLAKRAYAGLSHQAKDAVDSWNVNWDKGALEQSFQNGGPVAAEIMQAFQPVRDKLRSIYGDTVPMYRGEKSEGPASADGRQLFSWTPLPDLAQKFAAGSLHGIPDPISDADIASAVEQYNKTGFTSFRGKKFKRRKQDPEAFDIYDRNNNYITDSDDLEEYLRDIQESNADYISELKGKGHVYHADVPVDSLVWIPTGGNLSQPEIIARYNPRRQPASVMAKAIIFLRQTTYQAV